MRLKIMERDNFKCVVCNSKDKTLNVHHGFYRKNGEPWEVPESTLWTVCNGCHLHLEHAFQAVKYRIGKIHPTILISNNGPCRMENIGISEALEYGFNPTEEDYKLCRLSALQNIFFHNDETEIEEELE